MIALTTLEGADTEREVRSLCATAMAPDPGDPATPQVAAVCLYAYMVPVAVDPLKGSNIPVAAEGRRAQFAAEVCAAEGLTPARADKVISQAIDR
jgi:deoxyribose-phosphate aldolase